MGSTKTNKILTGFTIVELLVTIVVIGILAAIVIVAYNGTQAKSYDVSIQSDLENMAGQFEGYRIQNDPINNPYHQFPSSETTLDTLDIKAAKNAYALSVNYNMIYCLQTSGTDAYQAYALIAQSKSGKVFMITQDGFKTNNLTVTDLTVSLCSTLGMSLISNGMSSPNTWQAWVQNN